MKKQTDCEISPHSDGWMSCDPGYRLRLTQMGSASGFSTGNRQGFALVTTLILVSILLGLIVALSSYISLRQQGSAAEGKVHAARQSALVGLRIALGELQTAAGPDQRVTASASMLGNSERQKVFGTRIFGQPSARELVFISPPRKAGGVPRVKFISQLITLPVPESSGSS